jgi:hypothetical protein
MLKVCALGTKGSNGTWGKVKNVYTDSGSPQQLV